MTVPSDSEMRELCAKATEGPWTAEERRQYMFREGGVDIRAPNAEGFINTICELSNYLGGRFGYDDIADGDVDAIRARNETERGRGWGIVEANSEFIAAAREWVPAALERLAHYEALCVMLGRMDPPAPSAPYENPQKERG